jgi:hypothetical protein
MMRFVQNLIPKRPEKEKGRRAPAGKGEGRKRNLEVNPVLLYALGLLILFRVYMGVFPPLEEKVDALRSERDQLQQVGNVVRLRAALQKLGEERDSLQSYLASQGRYSSEIEGYSALYDILVRSGVRNFRLSAPEASPSPHPLLKQFLLSLAFSGDPEKVASVLVQMGEGGFRIKQIALTPGYDDRGGGMSLNVDITATYFIATQKVGR